MLTDHFSTLDSYQMTTKTLMTVSCTQESASLERNVPHKNVSKDLSFTMMTTKVGTFPGGGSNGAKQPICGSGSIRL